MKHTPEHVIKSYYAAYQSGDLVETARWVSPDCVIDEPTFLPYGRIDVIGAQAMFDKIGGTFFKLFAPDTRLENTLYFVNGDAVITNAVWHMTGLHTGRHIACHYQEYFEVREGLITLMRPFYHAAREMLEEIAAAERVGVTLDLA